ncbi:MAG: metal ABC transporter permease [Actinomycetota bacterium]|nr:metal ABC transporter permease [Actinomycetota bacterium]
MTWPPFLLHALLAGTAIAAAVGLVGYFVVLRAQVFTGDALSHVAFTGALAALALGIDQRFGLFTATIGVGVLLGALGDRGRADDVVIGSVFAWILGLGVLFLSLYTSRHSAANGTAGVDILFGSLFGLSFSRAVISALIAVVIVAAIIAIARPLLFASIDSAVAAARGIPVRLLGYGFLALVGAAAAEASQAVGALLLLGLLAAPAGTAQRLTTRPYSALFLSAGLAVATVWAGLLFSYLLPVLPPSFAILAAATGGYLLALIVTRHREQLQAELPTER